jgi:hypothetical protein
MNPRIVFYAKIRKKSPLNEKENNIYMFLNQTIKARKIKFWPLTEADMLCTLKKYASRRC